MPKELSAELTAQGYGMHIVFGTGAIFAAISLVCMILLERELKKDCG